MKVFLTIVLIILAIAIFVVMGFQHDENGFKANKKQFLCVIPLAIILIMNCFAWVPSNNVGIKWSAFSGTSEKTLGEGVQIKSPLDKVYLIPTTVQERTMKDVVVQTKDAQSVTAEVNVKFAVNKKDAFKVYKRFGDLDALKKNIISNYAQMAIEQTVTKYNVIDAIGSKKNEIYKIATNDFEERLSKEGVQLVSLTIKDMEPDAAISRAISDEAVAKKEVETAEQKKQKAEKEAETKIIEAEAESKANKLKESSLTKEILMQQMIEKWNGELPKVTDSSSGLFNLDSLLK